MKLKTKNRSPIYDINGPGLRYGHKYTKYKNTKNIKCIMMVICIKQHLNHIWSSIHGKTKQHWGWVKKSVAYKKKHVVLNCRDFHIFDRSFMISSHRIPPIAICIFIGAIPEVRH